ncbi:MAG: putative Mg2+ transporter-C (MgtC) family protein, partial [Gaiellaceae bacterium]|nr:putative Mg2+ transporter-C (MgtC) family protein [Gaiellaceae bacterium]
AGLGMAIGIERELRDREAGLRTHVLVSVGSALFTIISAYGFHDLLANGGPVIRADPTRIAAQIVTGIGFLGAGAIIREGLSIRGLTTAATLWGVAAIGMAAGAGYYSAALFGTAIVLLALWPLRALAFRVLERARPEEQRIVIELTGATSRLLAELEQRDAHVTHFETSDEADRHVVTLELDHVTEELAAHLADLDYVVGVRWHR